MCFFFFISSFARRSLLFPFLSVCIICLFLFFNNCYYCCKNVSSLRAFGRPLRLAYPPVAERRWKRHRAVFADNRVFLFILSTYIFIFFKYLLQAFVASVKIDLEGSTGSTSARTSRARTHGSKKIPIIDE